MSMSERRKNRRRQITVSLICLAAIGYFAVHATRGRHSLGSRQKLIDRAALLGAEIERLEAVRTRLATDVGLLNREPPDADLITELATDLLGLMAPDARPVLGKAPH